MKLFIKFFTASLIFISIEVKSQELLRATKNDIKKKMESKGGILKMDRIGIDFPEVNHPNILLFFFSKSNNDIFQASFFLSHNKCYKYTLNYTDNKNLRLIIDKFDSATSKFKRIGKNRKWENSKKDQIEILDNYVNGKKTSAFSVEFRSRQ